MAKRIDWTDPGHWAELEASENVFALVVMAQIRAKVTENAETLKGWTFRLIRMLYERGYKRALILDLFQLIDCGAIAGEIGDGGKQGTNHDSSRDRSPDSSGSTGASKPAKRPVPLSRMRTQAKAFLGSMARMADVAGWIARYVTCQ